MPRPYVPLHLHSHYSILDGATRISDLIEIAQANNMPAVAVTDHGVMHGAIELYRKAKEVDIKPIIGCEIYVIDGDIANRTNKTQYYHMVLLAKNGTGYKNLVKLVTKAHIEGYYYKPRINWEHLAGCSDGLIALTACLSGPISTPLLRNNPQEARERALWLKNVFGKDFYLEIQDHGIEGEKRINPQIINLGRELDIDLVVTNDSHYSRKSDAEMHDVLLCLQTGKMLDDPARMRFYGPSFYIKNGDEMMNSFDGLDESVIAEAIENTVKIAEKCYLELELDKPILPDYPVPEGKTAESFLRERVYSSALDRYGKLSTELENRIEYELNIINQMGFPAYFLIVWDFINHARQNNIPVGPGRGSAAGSLVAYSLGITSIDPIEHNLLFERFLNPERISMPDIDIDFCIEKREEVIRYVANRYGQDRVAQIITFGTLAARAALKGVARVMDIPFAESDRLAKMIPSTPGTRLKDAIEPNMELGRIYASDSRVRQIVDLALQIEGLNASNGVHAAGVVISRDPLEQIIPLQVSKEGQIVTQYAMDDVARLGLLKMDFLGLRNLTTMNNTVHLIQKYKNHSIDLDKLSLDDPAVYSMLTSGHTDGVFQLESAGMKTLVKELKPNHFEDINALVALFRPGPLNSGMVEEFVKRKHGKSHVEYAHPDLEPILKDTYGTIVYQEQIMQIAQVLAGYTLGQADLLRRAMGKKKEEEMLKQRELFLEGARKRNLDEKVANQLFDAMTEFAKYCFNRSHSAAYAMIAYQTAYLKSHFPVEYLSSLLSSVRSDLDKIQLYILTARKMGINVLPPDINKSDADFTPDGEAIRFGLTSIKNVGEGVVERIVKVRSESVFKDLEDFCERAELKSINRRTFESLILVGAFDSFNISRRQLFINIDNLYQYAGRIAERKETGQVSLFAVISNNEESAFRERLTFMGEPYEYNSTEIQHYEKELLGSYVTSHPLDNVLDIMPLAATASVKEMPDLPDGSQVVAAGMISTIVHKTTKTNKPLRIGQLEDLTGNVEFVAFSESIQQYADLLSEGQKVVLNGKLQYRGDDSISIVVNTLRPLEDVKVVNLYFKNIPRFEEIIAIKEILGRFKGEDPVILNWPDKTRMQTGPQCWINYGLAKTALPDIMQQQFKDLVAIEEEPLTLSLSS